MQVSEARLNANRANSLKSSGPSAEGRDVSRRNGLKHGLTGQGLVISEQDAAEVDRRAAAFRVEFDPKSTVGLAMIGQLAILSVRMDRAAKHEFEAVARQTRHAVEAFDHDRIDTAESLYDAIGDDPRRSLRMLKRTPEGADRLLEAWGELKDDLGRPEGPHWTDWHRSTIAHLSGFRAERAQGSMVDRLSAAVQGEAVHFANPEFAGLGPEAHRGWAKDRLIEVIDDEVASLHAHRATFDFDAIDRDRLGAAEVALFDASREACLARRYEADASRRFFKALKQLREAEAEAATRPTPRPLPPIEPIREPERLASSCAFEGPGLDQPEPTVSDESVWSKSPRDSAARGLDGRVIAVGRAVIMTQ
jgi:hypothetical protein